MTAPRIRGKRGDLTRGLDQAVLRPDDPDGELYEMVCGAMWLGFVRWAWSSAQVRKDFTAATGVVLVERRTAIEALIDKVTGYGADVMEQFVEWATVELYGVEAAPAAYRAEIEKRRRERARAGKGVKRTARPARRAR